MSETQHDGNRQAEPDQEREETTGDRDGDTWMAEARQQYEIAPEEVDRTELNEYTTCWVINESPRSQTSAQNSTELHLPTNPTASEGDDVEPLCNTVGSGQWTAKPTAIYPGEWFLQRMCSKCESILANEDYCRSGE